MKFTSRSFCQQVSTRVPLEAQTYLAHNLFQPVSKLTVIHSFRDPLSELAPCSVHPYTALSKELHKKSGEASEC
jgi:hypothetical protein